jgi:CBS domain-containing protein
VKLDRQTRNKGKAMASKKIEDLVASDIMQRNLVVVYDRETLKDALDLMTENHVTGLPVVNSDGVCVGVITATDILNYEQEHSEFTAEANADLAHHFNADTQQWESVRVTSFALEEFGEVRVEEVMSPDLVNVEMQTPVREVAKKMFSAKIHRVLVTNEDGRIYGIISAFDFVRLYAEGR